MGDHASAVPPMCAGDTRRVPWTAQLEVFDQDFDTAMAIWSVEDAVVGRLCADQPTMTRRQSQLSSSQIEFSQFSDCSQREPRPSRSKKRRRTATTHEGAQARDAPPAPLHCSVGCTGQSQDRSATQLLSMESVDSSMGASQGVATRDVDAQDIDAVAEARCTTATTPLKQNAIDVFRASMVGRRVDNGEFKSPVQTSSFSQSDVVRESPPDYPSTREWVDTRLHHPGDEDTSFNSGFSTGSGLAVMVSRKRLREVEAEWSAVDRVAKLDSASESDKIQTSSPHARQGERSGAVPASKLSTQDSIAVIDPKRLSYSAMDDEVHDDRSRDIGFQTGSGRRLQLNQESLRKYEALLFTDSANPNEESTFRNPTRLRSPRPDSVERLIELTDSGTRPGYAAFTKQDGGALDEAAGPGRASTGFRTGAGRMVAVSQERLHQYGNAIFAENDDQHSRQQSGIGSYGQPHSLALNCQKTDRPSPPLCAPDISAASGFQTASGRAVVICEERLKDFEDRLFGEDRTSVSSKEIPENGVLQRSADADSSTVASGFQTGTGTSVHISRSRLQEYELKAISDGEVFTRAQDHVDHLATKSEGSSSTTVLAGFMTGSGGKVSVSKERLRMYEEKLNDDDGAEVKGSATTTTSQDRAGAEGHSGEFVTARGKKVVVSEKKVREYARNLNEYDAVDASARPQSHQQVSKIIDSASSFVGGFTTGAGRRVAISEEKLRQYEEKMAMSEAMLGRGQRDNASEGQIDDEENSPGSRKMDAEGATVVLGGFTTGDGQGVSVSEKTLREYQAKISQSFNGESSVCETVAICGLPDEQHAAKDGAPITKDHESRSQRRDGQPSQRHSFGSLNSSIAIEQANRRRSLPPRPQVKVAEETTATAVSSGVIQRLAVAHQRNTRPSFLNDVSNIPASRSRISGLSGGGKWKPPSQLQGSQGGGYSTPAKPRTAGPQNLSAKKGFRPPVPSKTPPSKAIMTLSSTPLQKLSHAVEIKATPQISMHFREAMRISYKLLNPESASDSHSFTSVTRAHVLRLISPEVATSLVFSSHDDELLQSVDPSDEMSMLGVMREMKERGYIGAEIAVTDDWFRNQFRWVVWKLATMELQAPRFLFGRYLTRSQVMYEICKRYQRDIILAQRSILKKILNRDANAASCMVLRVAAVLPFPVEDEKDVDIVLPPHWKLSVVLTDGWHGIYAVPDPYLAEALWKHHKADRLIGRKIVTWSASLQNINDGVDPLECALATEKQWANPLRAGKDDPSRWPYVKLQSNSTRPVKVDTRLGLESLVRPALGRQSDAPYDFVMLKSIPMRTLEVGGGIVRSVRVCVVRISPILHLQSKDFSIGPRILCEEHMAQYFQARQEHLQSQRNEDAADDDDSSLLLPLPVPFVKLEVECAHETDPKRKCYAVLTVWRPGDEMLSKIKEGGKYYVTSLSVNWKIDYGHQGVFMRVGTTKGSAFERAGSDEDDHSTVPSRVCETIGELAERYQQHIMTMPKEKKLYGDVCVVIVRCEDGKKSIDRPPEASSVTSTEHIFVTDTSGRLMSLRLHSMRVYKPSTSAGDQASRNSSSRKKAPESVFTRGNKKLWSEGTVVCISGLEVSHYDDKLGVLDCELVESAQILSLPSKKSHFFQAAQSLRERLVCGDDTASGAQDMARSIQGLKKHVERTILQLDFEPSQEENDGGSTVGHDGDEAEFLTHELQGQPEDDVNYWMSQAPVIYVEGIVAKILPLHARDPLLNACGVVAVAYVRSNSQEDEENSFHSIYMTKETLERTHDFLSSGLDGSSSPGSIEAKADPVLRFEAQWETSERLLNSWKPWERDGGATFLLAAVVSAGRFSEYS